MFAPRAPRVPRARDYCPFGWEKVRRDVVRPWTRLEGPPWQGCIGSEGTSEAVPQAIGQAVGGSCQLASPTQISCNHKTPGGAGGGVRARQGQKYQILLVFCSSNLQQQQQHNNFKKPGHGINWANYANPKVLGDASFL